MTRTERTPGKTTSPWVFWLAAVALLPVIVLAFGVGAGFNAAHVEDGGSPSLLPYSPAALLLVLWAAVVGFGLRSFRRSADQRRLSGPQTFIAVMVASVALGLALGVVGALVTNIWVELTARIAALVAGTVLSLIYWRRIDEAAREAQKSAWLWGAGAGVVLCAVFEPLVRSAQGRPNLPLLVGDGSSHDWLVSGALYLLFAQGVGALLVWSAWWIRAR